MVAKVNAFLNKFVGPNAAHVLDALVAFELTAAGAAVATPSARTYADHHPYVAVAFGIAPPLLTGLASKFRKASHHLATPSVAVTNVTTTTTAAPAPSDAPAG